MVLTDPFCFFDVSGRKEKLRVTQEQDIFLSAKHLLSELLSESVSSWTQFSKFFFLQKNLLQKVAKLIESIDQCQHMIESFDLVAELHSFGLKYDSFWKF
jgi:hypothetical protein